MNDICLISDIGGTNIRFAIASKKSKNYQLLKHYKCNSFTSLEEAIKTYLESISKEFQPKKAILAIAAVISSDTISMTNHNWSFSISELTKKLNFESLKVINDFEAQAYSVPFLTQNDKDYIIKAKNINSKFQNLVIAGSGTGLGTALLLNNDGLYNVVPTECGHTMIGSYNEKEDFIFNYFSTKNKGSHYAEAFLSGQGILNIYRALCKKQNLEFDENVSSQFIFNEALKDFYKKENSIYLQTMETFFEFLGTYMSNLALTFLPKEIYLTGGILPTILPYIKEGSFTNRFFDKKLPTIQNILNSVSVSIITMENPAMLGLAMDFINSND